MPVRPLIQSLPADSRAQWKQILSDDETGCYSYLLQPPTTDPPVHTPSGGGADREAGHSGEGNLGGSAKGEDGFDIVTRWSKDK